MRVICINDKWVNASDVKNPPHPKFGEICEVIDTRIIRGILNYALEGYMPDILGYVAAMFAPLDGPCETEILAERLDKELAEFVLTSEKA